MKTDVIIVSSPLQLLCAIEWKTKHNNAIIFVRHTSRKSTEQINKIKNFYEIETFESGGHNPAQNFLSFLKISFSLIVNSGKLMIGEYHLSRFNQLLCFIFGFKEKYLIDDGFATITFFEKIASKRININLFTIFNFKNKKYDSQKIIKNKMSILERKKQKKTNDAIFIGTDELSKEWVGGPKKYFEHVKKIAELDHINDLYYVPKTHGHAFSSIQHSDLKSIPNLKFLKCDYPIEMHLSINKIRFKYAYSHMSTAIYSLSILGLIDEAYFLTSEDIAKHELVNYVHSSSKKYIENINFHKIEAMNG